MKSLWFAAVVAALGAAPAGAADVSARAWTKAVAPSDPTHNWGGWYIGGSAGGGWGRSNVSSAFVNGTAPIANQQAAAAAASPTLTPNGFAGGGQLGYNHQVDRWLFGVEADVSALSQRQSRSITAPFPVGVGAFSTSNTVSTDWLMSLRPRVGYAVDNTLVYVSGGLALTEMKVSSTLADSTGANAAATFTRAVAGWTVGAGVEHAFNSTGPPRSNISIPTSASRPSPARSSPDRRRQTASSLRISISRPAPSVVA